MTPGPKPRRCTDYDELQPGANYYAFCQAKAAEGHAAAVIAAAGIAEMIAGTREFYRYIYHGNDRWQGRAFQLSVIRLEIDGHAFIAVTRSDVTELVHLRQMREHFSQSLMEGQSEDRRKVARDIHDSMMQSLVALDLSIGLLKRSNSPEAMFGAVAEMEAILAGAQREVRAISFLMHPPLLEEMGLGAVLQGLVEGFQKRTGVETSLTFEGDVNFDWRAAEVAVYRMVQEALSNVHRHARATAAGVRHSLPKGNDSCHGRGQRYRHSRGREKWRGTRRDAGAFQRIGRPPDGKIGDAGDDVVCKSALTVPYQGRGDLTVRT